MGTRLTVAKGDTLREVSNGEVTNECRDNDGGRESYLPKRERSEMERNCETSAYCETYCAEMKTANVNAYRNMSETYESPSGTKRRTQSPASENGDDDNPSPCAARRV